MNSWIWQNFFAKFIDGYLVSDLKRLDNLETINGPGNCGYFIVQGVFAGYDLLGSLVGSGWTPNSGSDDFDLFIEKYMKPINPDYYTLKQNLWKSIRNKLAHSYLTQDFVVVDKGVGEKALVVKDGTLHIFCKNLVADFQEAIITVKLEIEHNQEFKTRVENNIQLMMDEYSLELSKSKHTQSLKEAIDTVRRETLLDSSRPVDLSLSTTPMNATLSASVLNIEEFRKLKNF